MNLHAALALSTLLLAGPAAGQDRPAEADLFGAPAPGEPAAPQSAAPVSEPATAAAGRDDAMLGARAGGPPAGVLSAAQENPLTLGGQLYLRSSASYVRFVPPSKWQLSSPNLVDLYVDTRPNDRVRAFALARTTWDPLALPPGASPFLASTGPDPRAALDQLWITFDVARTVFVTVGKQHVKWGVGQFWNPTDYLHPVRRDPLATFDARTGATMVKLHVPWEAKGWNLYGIALLDDPAGKGDSATAVGKVAGGARAEIVLGTVELGADALVRRGQRPRFGVDFSAGVWDLDVHGEVALRTSSDVQLWREANPDGPLVGLSPRFVPRSLDGLSAQAVIGVSYAVNYSDEDAVRFGAEYFYNGPGYDDPHIYPWLLVEPAWFGLLAVDVANAIGITKTNDFRSFYVGRHYAGLSVVVAAPGSWNDHTFSLAAIANASDGSGIVRLDHSVVVNTYLRVESYLAGYVGKEGGEFRFSLDVPPQTVGFVTTPALRTQPPVMMAGVALRVKL